ncbi:MAG TPA: hypothetical protein PLK90_01805 [Clostridiales bacterium]|nr:hypothetical protein [Clostridiales bacterium]HQP69110.1 hypothetical protein [Clostridiales bacterium]
MKIRNRIFYYAVLSVLILYAAYNFIQKAVISPMIRKSIVEKIGPVLQADRFDIESMNLSLTRLRLNNILYQKANTKALIERLDIDFSVKGSLLNLIKLKGWFFEAETVDIRGCDIVIDPEIKADTEKPWKFSYQDFQNISVFLKEYDFIKSIAISDVNLIYSPKMRLPLISGMKCSAAYTDEGGINLMLNGRFINSFDDNITLKGYLDNNVHSADINLDFSGGGLEDFRSPFGLYKINSGRYSGGAKLDINSGNSKTIDLTGDFKLSDLDAEFGKKVYLTNTGFDMSYYNGTVVLNKIEGRLNGIPYIGQGKILHILDPEGDIFFDIKNVGGRDIINALTPAGIDKTILNSIDIGDDNSLGLHVSGGFRDPLAKFELKSGSISYSDYTVSDISIEGSYSSGSVSIEKAEMSFRENEITASGNIKRIFSSEPEYEFNFKSSGPVFSSFEAASEHLKSQSGVIEGIASGSIGSLPEVKANITTFSSVEKGRNAEIFCGLSFHNGIAGCSIGGKNKINAATGTYDVKQKRYMLKGNDLMYLYRLYYGSDLFENEDSLFYELSGDHGHLLIRTGSADKNSLFYGNLSADIKLGNDSLHSTVNWTPAKSNILIRPINFSIKKAGDSLSVSNVYFDSKHIPGRAAIDLKSRSISGRLENMNMDFGDFFGIGGLRSNTDIVLMLKGNISAPYADLYINENKLVYEDSESDSISVSGEAEVHLENKKLRIEKVIIYDGAEKIATLSGTVRDFKRAELSAHGKFGAEYFNPFLKKVKLSGDLDFNADLAGNLNDLKLKKSAIELINGSVNGDSIKKFEFATSELDSSGVLITKFLIDVGNYLKLNAEGFIPYDSASEIFLTGDFTGDFISYADKKTKLISKGSSSSRGKFTAGGKFRKPKLKSLELEIDDGKFIPKGSAEGFENVRAFITVDEALNIDILRLKMRSVYSEGTLQILNSRNDPKYNDIILPGGFNLGHITIKSSDKGIDFHAFNMMLPKDFGNFVLSGINDDKFRIYKKGDAFALEGKLYLRNSRITYPFLSETRSESKSEEKENPSNIFSDLWLDLEVIPASNNTYFFNTDTEEKDIWDRFLRSFSQIEGNLSDVNIAISPNSKGLSIKGPVNKAKEIEIFGELTGNKGTCNYSAFSFKVDDFSVRFDGAKNARGFTDPYLKGSAVTTIKTMVDSTGFSTYENIYLKAVTKEDDQIIDSEGARISELSVILTDAYGNPWFDRDDKIYEIDTKGTAQQLFEEAVDTRLLSPILSPLETAIGRALGAHVSIRPSISGNFVNDELGMLEVPENYAEYFVGSEFYISKFITDNIALTWNSKYIGSEEYTEITERDYGYKNSLSLDYRLSNFLFTSAGYQYDSIKDEYGYNLALTYRYRFMNISEPYNYLRNAYMKLRKR